MPILDVGDAVREMRAGSKHIKTRAQAIAVGLKAERKRSRENRVAAAYMRGLRGDR